MAIQNGDTVAILYEVSLEDGRVVDSNREGEPLVFEIGGGQLIPGVEESLVGRKVGEQFEIDVPPEKGYGAHNEALVQEVPLSMFGENKPNEGDMVGVTDNAGNTAMATVAKIGDEAAVLDMNHPLAGQTLQFALEIVEAPESA